MKTQLNHFGLLLLIGLFFSAYKSQAQNYAYKGMYVYTLDSILNDASGKTEDVLFRYCRDSSINALTLSVGAYNLNTSPSYVTKLAAFMKKGKTRYGIKYFTAVFSDYATLLNEIHFYQNSRTDTLERFNYYNYEFEYWNNNFYTATGSSETAYCTKYLQPNNCSCDSVGAWNYFAKYIKRVDSLAQADNIKSSLYIGVKSKDTLKNRFIANTVDLIMIACYKNLPADLFQTHTTGKFTAFSKANHKVNVIPIFASLTQSASENLKEWLKGAAPTGKHSESSAMPVFMSEYNLLPSNVKNNLNIIGYQWFKYGGMPKDSSFNAISITPSGLVATPTSTTAALAWTAVNGANQYSIWYAPANIYNWTKLTSTTAAATLSGLSSDNTYQFLVFAKTNSGNTASSQVASFSTTSATTTCVKATGLSTSNLSSTSVNLNWLAAQGAAGYNVRYKLITQTSWMSATALSTTHSLSALSPASNYEFQVQTNCGNATSDFTTSVTFTTMAAACGIPSALSSSAITAASATLAWAAVNGAIGYTVAYRLGSAVNWISQSVATNSLLLNGLNPASAYEFQVQAQCGASNLSSFSTISGFSTANPVCGVPAGVTAAAITSSGATISWSAMQYASSYLIQYRVKGTSIWTSTTSAATSVLLTGLSSGSVYEYAVQSYCSATNLSAFSATAEFTTQVNCASPGSVGVSATTSNTATLTWVASANALSYKLEYKLPAASTWTAVNSTSANQTISALSAATTYQYHLQAVCAATSSAFTTTAQFTTAALSLTCDVPQGLAVTAIYSTSATLNWTAVSGVSSYKVQYRKIGSSVWTNKTTSNNYKIISSLKSGTGYEFKVQSVCSASLSSAYSAVFVFNTKGATTKAASQTYAMRTTQGIRIKWSSSDEEGASYYIIEKSTDGDEFEPFKTVSVEYNNFSGAEYEIEDVEFDAQDASASIWYKISLIDVDGNSAYLRTIEVMPKTEFADEFKIYPNPNPGDQINLNVKLEKKEEILVVLMDIFGNLVYSKVMITDDNGAIATAINPTQELAKGIYQVVGYSSTKTLSQKLIVK